MRRDVVLCRTMLECWQYFIMYHMQENITQELAPFTDGAVGVRYRLVSADRITGISFDAFQSSLYFCFHPKLISFYA